MSNVLPKSESLKRAVTWISNQRLFEVKENLSDLIDEAVFKFDLNPQDAKYLYNFYEKLK